MFKHLRYGRVFFLLALFLMLLIAMWPVLIATLAIFLLVDFANDDNKPANTKKEIIYTKTKSALFLFAMLLAIFLITECIFYWYGVSNLEFQEMRNIFHELKNNVLNGYIFSNFKIYLATNHLLFEIYVLIGCFVSAVLFAIIEREEKIKFYKKQYNTKKYKKKQEKQFVNNRDMSMEKYSPDNFSNPLQIFLVRPRLLILIIVNYLIFWYRVGYPLIENIYVAIIYVALIAISLTDFAEKIFRAFKDVRHIATNTEKERLLLLFESVKEQCMKNSTVIDDKVKLYIVDNMSVNAFVIGKHTIAITRGLMYSMNDEELEAVISHEMAHIMNGDGQVSMLVTISSNIYIWSIILLSKIMCFIEMMAGEKSFLGSLVAFVKNIVDLILNYTIMALTILVSSTSRKEEYKADKVAFELGYGEALLSALYKLYDMEISDNKKLLEKLQSSHPKTAFRIEALETMCRA